MRLLFNIIALLLATTALAAPVPSRPSDALTDDVSTSEHTLVHHHHVHNSKHAKHVHHEEPEVETRSLFNDELEERSFYDEYTQLERRGPGPGGDKGKGKEQDKGKGKAKPNLSVFTKFTAAVTKFQKAKPASALSNPSSSHSIDHERMAGTHVPGHIANHITPLNLPHAGTSNHASTSKAAEANRNKPLPPLPHSPHRSNSLPASFGSSHHDAPPPYSAHPPALHVANPGSPSSASGSVRQPHRSNSVGSNISNAASRASVDRFSINTVNSPHLSDHSSVNWNSPSK